jgi:general nucleoside transport system ATP-binding protein
MSDVDKAFGPVQANRGASLEVARGEIHALVGENGAGKSTLMRVLSGMFEPNRGRIEVEGRDVTGWHTNAAIDAGVGMVHQHFMLVPTLTVAENLVLGQEPRKSGQLDKARAEREVHELSERTGLVVPADRKVSELSVGEAQRVEILKALYRGARILILDEPTAVLSPPEVRELWQVLRRLRAEAGGTVVLITHKLDEVMEVSDAVTVMRGGRTVARMRTSETSPREIARAMVGRDVSLAMDQGVPSSEFQVPASATRNLEPATRNSALHVRDLVVAGPRKAAAVERVSLAIAPGEIFGIAGVEGNGQTELVEAIAGLRPVVSGQIMLAGAGGAPRDVTKATVRERADAGLSHIPEDRHARGLILDYTIEDNLILGQHHHFSRGLRLDPVRIAENARQKVREFDIRPPDASLPARALSGGNQQKVVIAREMGRNFRVLLAAQPTRGVDVGAIEFIHARLRDARRDGKAILLVSADLAEVLALSDRIGVMYGGRLVAVLPRADANLEVLGRHMTGAAEAA